MTRRATSEDGQGMVEFALVAPILILVVVALMQFGVYYGKQLELQSATRDAARKASISVDAQDPVASVREALIDQASLSNEDDLAITVTPQPPWDHGELVTVSAATPHSFGLPGGLSYDGLIRAEAEVRVE